MIAFDTNIVIYAFRSDDPNHEVYRNWLIDILNSPGSFGYSELALSSFVRIVTNPRAFKNPDSLADAFEFCEKIISRPQAIKLNPGAQHWNIFRDLAKAAEARGNLITDAYLAALAIEHNCTWYSTDRDYARFPNLKWKHPLQA